jgi:acyl-CoA synthetase (AMP-forming)/AMP-acid ligase II
MTIAALVRHAAARPDAVAVIHNGARIAYPALARALAQVIQALRALGLRPGDTAAIECTDAYGQLLLILACQGLGVATAAFHAGELLAPRPLPLLAQVDIVLTEQPGRVAGAKRVHAIGRSWLDNILASPVAPIPAPPNGADDPIFFQRTSGTTGSPKRLLVRRRNFEGRIASWTRIDEIGAGHRVLIAIPFTLASAYWQSAMALRAGATIVFENRIAPAEALMLHRIDRVTMVPLMLREMLDRLPKHFVRWPGLAITTIGGRVPPALRRRALDVVAARLREVYSGNEAGNIAVIETDAVAPIGTLCPGATVEIVDEQDRVLGLGKPGRIRVRTDYMADGYLDDPETTQRMFRGGWFHPGDMGILHEARRLEVLGRDDEMLNIGGHKVMPADLEETIRARVAVADLGVCAVPNAEGIDEIWVAAVYDAPDDRDIMARLKPGFVDYPFGGVHLVKLDRIPRTETGKIKRGELRQAVIAAARPRL